MRAYVLESFDTSPRMVEVPRPQPAQGELLIRVHAVSVNPVDLAIAGGEAKDWLEYRFPVTIGRDLAGIVEEVGPGVSGFSPGDRVLGYIARDYAHDGSFADYVVVPEGEFVVTAPDELDLVEAASLGLAAVTATMCVDAAAVASGGSLLVNGATGGVGGYAVQFGKARGAYVVGSARPGEEEEHVRALGADRVVDWAAPGFAQRARATAPTPDGFDALVDLVTGDPGALTALAKTVLRPGGAAATTLNAADEDGLDGVTGANVWSSPDIQRIEQVAAMAGEGRVRAPVKRTYSFDELEQALDAVRTGAVGKIAVRLVG